jgi:hypothetical protein
MREKMKKLKLYQDVYLIVLWISIQIIIGTYIKRNLISEDWIYQFGIISFLVGVGQFIILLNYIIKKYD